MNDYNILILLNYVWSVFRPASGDSAVKKDYPLPRSPAEFQFPMCRVFAMDAGVLPLSL